MNRLRPILNAAAALLLAGCLGGIEPEPVLDDEGNPVALPGPFDDWLRLESQALPEAIAPRPALALRFNDYLDDNSFASRTVLELVSGGIRYGGEARYEASRRRLVWRPVRALEPDILMRLELDTSITSATGAPLLLDEAQLPRIRVSAGLPEAAPDPPAATWPEVQAIFEARCNGCHDDPAWRQPALRPATLTGVRSSQLERQLVKAFDPADSYLLHKLLPDYADRRFGQHPPSWSDDPRPLTTQELATIESWIADGAKFQDAP